AVADPFWRRPPEPVARYDDWPHRQQRTPHWLPFYWSQLLEGQERAALIGLLDRLASTPATPIDLGWDAGTCARELAAAYIVQQAPHLATACRAGQVPLACSTCYFWSGEGYQDCERRLGEFPLGFAEVFAALRAHQSRWEQLSRQHSDARWQWQ